MKVALAHDWLTVMRGGERVLERLCLMFPDAPIYTLLARPGATSKAIESHPIHTSFIQRMPWASRVYRWYLPLFPRAIADLRVEGFDAVISLSHCAVKAIPTTPGTFHLSYVFTPMRYIWELERQYFPDGKFPWPVSSYIRRTCARLRTWDVATSAQPDAMVAISRHVAGRIRRHYGRDADVVYPPVSLERFVAPSSPTRASEDFYLLAGAFAPYKRGDLAVEACTRLGRRLIVLGSGQDEKRLRRLAGPTVVFQGRTSDREMAEMYRGARALLFPGEEDFGIVPLEAMASGCPVIAYAHGGALETVAAGAPPDDVARAAEGGFARVPGGLLFGTQTVDGLDEAIRRFATLVRPACARRRGAAVLDRALRSRVPRDVRAPPSCLARARRAPRAGATRRRRGRCDGMRVGLDARKLWDGGIGTYTRHLVRAALALPDAPRFVLFVDPADRDSAAFPPGEIEEHAVRAGKYSIGEHVVLARAARRARVDLFHAPHYTLPLGWRGPAVVTIHDLAHVRFARYFPPGASLYARVLAGDAARRARLVLTVSRSAAADLEEILGVPESKVRVIPLAVSSGIRRRPPGEVSAFASARSLPGDYLLYVGARKRLKNLTLVLEALSRMPAPRPALVLSGPPFHQGDALGATARALGVEGSIRFAGDLRDDDALACLYSGASLYLQPSLTESFGLPPLEAMACGVPVLAARTGGLPDTLGDAAVWLEPRDPAAWAEAITGWLADAEGRERLGRRGIEQAARFSWERTAAMTIAAYAEAAGVASARSRPGTPAPASGR